MNDETPEPFDTVGDAPVEARIVAWALGEASAFEAAELERLCEEKPELLVFRRRMCALHGLLTEVEASEADHGWKLPPDKRKRLDEIFGDEEEVARFDQKRDTRISRAGIRAFFAIAACLMLALVLWQLVSPVWVTQTSPPAFEKTVDFMPQWGNGGGGQEAAETFNRAIRDQEDKVEERRKTLATIVRTKGVIYKGQDSFYGDADVDARKDEVISRGLDAQEYVEAKRDFETDQQLLQAMKLAQINQAIEAKMPAESAAIYEMPRGDTALAAANRPASALPSSPAAPQVAAAKPAEGASAGYAMSLAKEKSGLHEERRNAQRSRLAGGSKTDAPAAVMAAEPAAGQLAEASEIAKMPALKGRGLAVNKDKDGVLRRVLEKQTDDPDAESDQQRISKRKLLAARDSVAGAAGGGKLDAFVGPSYADAVSPAPDMPTLSNKAPVTPSSQSVADDGFNSVSEFVVPTQGLRSGDQAITRNSIDAILNSPGRSGADLVKPTEETLPEDPIRTNAELTTEHAGKEDQVRRSLYAAEGNYSLGKYDEARSEYEKILRSDPYNSAARRGMERIATARTDYYRAAYDHTRAELLSQVDAAWELEVPADRVVAGKKMEAKAKQELAQQLVPIETVDEVSASGDPYSTFSLNISDASFQLAKAALAKGERPDPESIKLEQFYNAVDYGDPGPSADEPVAATIGQSAHPVIPGRNLVRVALRTASVGRAASQPLRLTLLVDQSGSMVREDRRTALEKALQQLGGLLTQNDVVSIVGFSRTPRLLADRLSGSEGATLSSIINQAASEGGTNLEEALKLGAIIAERQQLAGAQNRIVLFTDGAANLGDADPDRLAMQVTALRQKGIAFDIAGIGADGLNDRLLGGLARHGNGRYYVVGDGADDSFAKQLAGAFRPAAENVKVQVILNPLRVGNYKLLGFEKDRLKTEDFRNDAVDAAELAADEAGAAIYQVEVLQEGKGEIGEVSVRFRDTASGEMVERSWTIPYEVAAPAFDRATPAMQLAGLSLMAAEKLRGGPMAGAIDFKQFAKPLAEVRRFYQSSARVGEMLQMIDAIK